jgi:hypothetical protein
MSTHIERLTNKIAKSTYVILLKDSAGKLTLLADPGMNQPWRANGPNPLRNKKTAEFHAKNCDGMACTWEEAFNLLRKEYPNFEKELHESLEQKVLHDKFKPRPTNLPPSTGLLDQYGKPIK